MKSRVMRLTWKNIFAVSVIWGAVSLWLGLREEENLSLPLGSILNRLSMLIKNKNNFTKILLFSNLTSILMFKECSFKLILFKKMGLKRNNIDIVLEYQFFLGAPQKNITLRFSIKDTTIYMKAILLMKTSNLIKYWLKPQKITQ